MFSTVRSFRPKVAMQCTYYLPTQIWAISLDCLVEQKCPVYSSGLSDIVISFDAYPLCNPKLPSILGGNNPTANNKGDRKNS